MRGRKRKVHGVTSKKKLRGLPPSLKAVYGVWADRTDLPRDSAEAVKLMRTRSAERRISGLKMPFPNGHIEK
jgi:hypothetical protein